MTDRFGIKRIVTAAFGAIMLSATAQAADLETLPFTLNWKLSGSHAPIFLAVDKGFFAEEGLDPDIVAGDGSANVVNRLASGSWNIGIGDIASVIHFNTLNPDQRVLAIYNQTPADLTVVTLAGRGIEGPGDLVGKTIGAPVGDTAFKMWPAFASATGLQEGDVTWEHMAANIREAMLMQGRVDAITANEGTAYFNLKGANVPDEDMVFIRYGENGVNLVNIGLMVNQSFAQERPELVRSVVRAVHRGYVAAMEDPQAALDSLMERDPLLNREIEEERFQYMVTRMIGQPDAEEGGLGYYSETTLAESISIIAAAEGLSEEISPSDVIDMSFLPPAEEREIPAFAAN
jgi:NitT/TauT family transport system substrate-binding protein